VSGETTVVYLAHPYASDPERNVRRITRLGKEILRLSLDGELRRRYLPVIPHLLLSFFSEGTNPAVRPLTESLSCRLVAGCDELWLMSETISKGMQLEIAAAEQQGMPIHDWVVVTGHIPGLLAVK
jgi:hypothetical protein